MIEGTVPDMRTTLNIDDDVLIAVQELARRQSRSVDEVASDLLRRSLMRRDEDGAVERGEDPEFGFRPFPGRGGIVTNDLVNRLRGEAGD